MVLQEELQKKVKGARTPARKKNFSIAYSDIRISTNCTNFIVGQKNKKSMIKNTFNHMRSAPSVNMRARQYFWTIPTNCFCLILFSPDYILIENVMGHFNS